jgi:hypothetical protein
VVGVTGNQAAAQKGYPRNYKGHFDSYTSKILDFTAPRPLCVKDNEKDQTTPNTNTKQFPPLSAAPGSIIQAQYTENGHITGPEERDNKPIPGYSSGLMYWYGWTDPAYQPTMQEVFLWTADGKGGNGKGRLLKDKVPYDNGVCAEANVKPISLQRIPQLYKKLENGTDILDAPLPRANIPCTTQFQLPEDLAGPTYTVAWVWDYSTKAGYVAADPYVRQSNEWYTTCMDIKIEKPAPAPKVRRRHVRDRRHPRGFAGRWTERL